MWRKTSKKVTERAAHGHRKETVNRAETLQYRQQNIQRDRGGRPRKKKTTPNTQNPGGETVK